MTSITIELPKDHAQRLHELAQQIGIRDEELIRISVEDLLAQPEERFRQVAEHVIKKNAGLYKRLAA